MVLIFIIMTNTTEEVEKVRFPDSLKRYVWCGETTTLYNGNSKICIACSQAEKCKQRLKQNYEGLYRIRNLDK